MSCSVCDARVYHMQRETRDGTLPSPSHSPKTTTVDDDEFKPPYLPYCSMKLPASGPPLCPDMKLAMLDSNGGVLDMTFMDEFDKTQFDKFNHKQLKHIAALFLLMATYKEYKTAQVLDHVVMHSTTPHHTSNTIRTARSCFNVFFLACPHRTPSHVPALRKICLHFSCRFS